MSGGGGFGKCCGYAEEVVGTVEKFGEGMVKWAWGVELLSPRGRMSGPGAGCPGRRMSGGRAGCPGSGAGTNTMNSSGKNATPGENSDELVDGKGGGGWGKLDPHAATQIHGPNPTKSQLTNKSQKKLGLFLVGNFRI